MHEIKNYGMHRHFTDFSSVLLFGGGVKKGYAHGETSQERPLTCLTPSVSISDLHATLYHAMGIPPDQAYEVEKRPFFVTKDGHGKPLASLFV